MFILLRISSSSFIDKFIKTVVKRKGSLHLIIIIRESVKGRSKSRFIPEYTGYVFGFDSFINQMSFDKIALYDGFQNQYTCKDPEHVVFNTLKIK